MKAPEPIPIGKRQKSMGNRSSIGNLKSPDFCFHLPLICGVFLQVPVLFRNHLHGCSIWFKMKPFFCFGVIIAISA
jgi:hypothetical protein